MNFTESTSDENRNVFDFIQINYFKSSQIGKELYT